MSRTATNPHDPLAMPYLVFDEIKLAYAAIESLFEEPADRGRLTVLHGPSGCGKSHLAHLLVRESARRQLISAYHFVPTDLREEELELPPEIPWPSGPVRRQSDAVRRLLICEDLQLAAWHESIQQTLIRWFDECRSVGVDVLVTMNRSPGDVARLIPRLRNRLRSAACIGLSLPNKASREQLIQHYCVHSQLALPSHVIRLLARELALSPRELFAALRRFDDFALQHVLLLDSRAAMAFLKTEVLPKSLEIDEISRVVAREFGVKIADMRSTARDTSLKTARQCAMYLARELTHAQYAKIGEYFSNRSHSTVMHACERISEQQQDDPALRQILTTVRQALGQR